MKHMRTFNPVSDGREFPMNHEVQVYESPEFSKIRAVMLEGKPWFIANDVAKALGYASPKHAVMAHCKRAKLFKGGETPPLKIPPRGVMVIPESDIYRLVSRSTLESAEAFFDWVCETVLPSIREKGSYSLAGDALVASDAEKFLARLNVNEGNVDPGCFSIFHELARIAPGLLRVGVPLDEHTMPDVSVGARWRDHWFGNGLEKKHGPRRRYKHYFPACFPQAKKNPVESWEYPLDALPDFIRWLNGVDIPLFFPLYMQRKVKENAISAPVATRAVEALQPKAIEEKKSA